MMTSKNRVKAHLVLALTLAMLVTACGAGEGGDPSGSAEAPIETADPEQVEAYPDRPIELVVPYPAGGGTDTVARIIQARLQEVAGQQVDAIVRSGGAGATGALHAIDQPADGYTLLAGENGIMTTGPLANPDTPYDAAEDLIGVSSFTADPWVLFVNSDTGIENVDDFVARSEEEPGSIGFAITSVLSADHYAMLLMQRALEYPEYRTIAYGGGGPKALAVLGGEADAMMEIASDAQAGMDDGLITPIMVLSDERLEALPDVPTAAEAGFENLTADTWQGVMVRRTTPTEIVDKLEGLLEETFNDEVFQERMTTLGAEVVYRNSEEFEEVMANERQQAEEIIEQINVDSIEEETTE